MVAPFAKRNRFNYKPDHLFTGKMGSLIPFIQFEVVPGDTFKVVADNMTRFQAMLSPAYAKIFTYTHFFFVPYRLLWDNWEDFITKGEDGQQAPNFPKITFASGQNVGTLADYFGLPTNEPAVGSTPARTVPMTVSAIPFRAYALIYNEWYRNQNLQSEVGFSTADGADTTTNTTLLQRNWRPDYFTQNLPFRQRGPQVTVPLGTSAPVYGNGRFFVEFKNSADEGLYTVASKSSAATGVTSPYTGVAYIPAGTNTERAVSGTPAWYIPTEQNLKNAGQTASMYTDLSQATSATISDWRLAFQIQRLLEKNARGGARYVEWLMSHFGVRCSDGRLQRPEYLGGGKSPVLISEILQTSSSDNTSPQGNMAGHAFSVQQSHSFTKSFDEYGIVIGIYSCMPKSLYYQGIRRSWLKDTPYDFYLPVLSHLSEQGTFNAEIYQTGTDATDKAIFGYNPIYEEYRHMYSTVSGEFKTSLDYWQFGRRWSSTPALNSQFATCVPTDAPFAVKNQDNLLVTTTTHIRAVRPIPKHGTPGYIDHD